MYRLICQTPAHFLSAQMALVSTFFQMFIVLAMHNFVVNLNETSGMLKALLLKEGKLQKDSSWALLAGKRQF